MKPEINFFSNPTHVTHRHYEALRLFFLNNATAQEVAERFGYTVSSVYSLTRDFRKLIQEDTDPALEFFTKAKLGRKEKEHTDELAHIIIELRKKYLSVPDIKAILDSLGEEASQGYIHRVIKKSGFSRLPRRSTDTKVDALSSVKIDAPRSELLDCDYDEFTSEGSIGILCMLPLIKQLGIDRLIKESGYPETKTIPRINSILSFLALKLSNINRYTADDLWCMDRGLGLFAGLNVLPKAAWYTSYSHRVRRKTNLEFLEKSFKTLA